MSTLIVFFIFSFCIGSEQNHFKTLCTVCGKKETKSKKRRRGKRSQFPFFGDGGRRRRMESENQIKL